MKAPYAIEVNTNYNIKYFEVFNTEEEVKQSTYKKDFQSSIVKKQLENILTYSINDAQKNHTALFNACRILTECSLFDLKKCDISKIAEDLCNENKGYSFLEMDNHARKNLNEASRAAHNILNNHEENAAFINQTGLQTTSVLEQYTVSKDILALITDVAKKIDPTYSLTPTFDKELSHFKHNSNTGRHCDAAWSLIFSANLSKGSNPTIIYKQGNKKYTVPDGYAVIFAGNNTKNPNTSITNKINGGKGIEHEAGEDILGLRTNLSIRILL